MSEYFDANANRIPVGALAKSDQVNQLRDDTGAGFDLIPDPSEFNTGKASYGVDTGTADTYEVALPSTQTVYTDALLVEFTPANANTGPSTLDVDGIGPKGIKRPDGTDLQAGDLTTDNPVSMRYNGSTFRYTGSAPVSSFVDADADAATASAAASAASTSETNAGISETNAGISETNAGISETNAAASAAAASTSETNAGISETNAAASAAAAAAATTFENLDANGDVGFGAAQVAQGSSVLQSYMSAGQTITSGGSLTLAHGLGAEPKIIQYILQCTSPELGYSIDDRVFVDYNSTSAAETRVNAPLVDSTNITIRFTNATDVFIVQNATDGIASTIDLSRWQLYVRAFA